MNVFEKFPECGWIGLCRRRNAYALSIHGIVVTGTETGLHCSACSTHNCLHIEAAARVLGAIPEIWDIETPLSVRDLKIASARRYAEAYWNRTLAKWHQRLGEIRNKTTASNRTTLLVQKNTEDAECVVCQCGEGTFLQCTTCRKSYHNDCMFTHIVHRRAQGDPVNCPTCRRNFE